MGLFEFDQDTRVTPAGEGSFATVITDRWNIGPVPNGGYVLAVAMAAMRQMVPMPDPISVTAHYLRPATIGPATVDVELVKTGRQFCTVAGRIRQGEAETVRLLASYGDLNRGNGPTHIAGTPPPLAPPETLPALAHHQAFEFMNRFELRTAALAFQPGQAQGPAEISGWIRFADGRKPDVHTLGLLADSFPPAVFHVLSPGWVPTIELTVHMRAHPVSQWLRCIFRTRFIFGGLLEEDGEIWDEEGNLVALSRQLACTPR